MAGIPCIDTIPALVLRVDLSGHALFVNAHWTALTGRPVADLLGTGWLDLIDPVHRRSLSFPGTGECPACVPMGIIDQRGQSICHAFTWSAVRDDSGMVVAYDGVAVDASIREAGSIAEPRGPSAGLLDRLPAMIWSTQADGHLDYANNRWLEHTGLDFEDAAGWNWRGAVHPDDVDGLVAYWSGLINSEQDGEYEYRLSHPLHGYRWVVSRATAHRDVDGKVLRWYGVRFDIEARRRAEDALRTSAAYLSQAQRLSQTGSIGLHLPGGLMYWSDETYRICGYGRDTCPSLKAFLAVAHPDDRQRLRALLSTTTPADGLAMEYRLLRADGSIRHVRLVGQVIATADGTECVGAIIDETDSRKAAADLEEARSHLAHVSRISTMGQMAASIAHEVTQPLAGILINCSSAMQWISDEGTQPDRARAAIERIIACTEWATSVVNNLHTFARRAPATRTTIDLNVVIEETMGFVRAELHRSNVALVLDLAHALPVITGDRVQIQQLVINIVSNAIHAMSGLPTRQVTVRTHVSTDDLVTLEIVDTGPGIDPDLADRLFTPFFTTRKHGMGMGLAICQTIMDQHGGRISASSNPGPGATFRLEFPSGR